MSGFGRARNATPFGRPNFEELEVLSTSRRVTFRINPHILKTPLQDLWLEELATLRDVLCCLWYEESTGVVQVSEHMQMHVEYNAYG
jgi:hypothetical protein